MVCRRMRRKLLEEATSASEVGNQRRRELQKESIGRARVREEAASAG